MTNSHVHPIFQGAISAIAPAGETLAQALASLGMTYRKSPRFYGKQIITDASGLDLGHFDASEGWDLVNKLRSEQEAA